MAEVLVIATGFVIVAAAIMSYQRTRDPLSAMVIFSPMLLYFYVYHALVVLQNPALPELIGVKDVFTTTAVVNLLGVSAFCAGCALAKRSRRRTGKSLSDVGDRFTNRGRGQVYLIAMSLGIVSVCVFWFLVWRSGGFARVFMSGGKPFLSGVGSGYVGELPMLSYPAMLLMAVARQGRRFRTQDFVAYVFCASPQIIWATLGGRRGPMFLLIMTLAASWMIVRSKQPKLSAVLAGLLSVGLVVLFLAASRQSLYLGSEKECFLNNPGITIYLAVERLSAANRARKALLRWIIPVLIANKFRCSLDAGPTGRNPGESIAIPGFRSAASRLPC